MGSSMELAPAKPITWKKRGNEGKKSKESGRLCLHTHLRDLPQGRAKEIQSWRETTSLSSWTSCGSVDAPLLPKPGYCCISWQRQFATSLDPWCPIKQCTPSPNYGTGLPSPGS
ncbi:unnamed protein product [Bubo scandiacus]